MILKSVKGISHIPGRIISLVPSITELLHYLGLEQETVGITRFCVHPKEWHISKTRIGRTKDINIKTIHSLQPHLVIANREENVKEQVEALAKDFPVWLTDVNNLEDAVQMIKDIGHLTGKPDEAIQLAGLISKRFNELKKMKNIESGTRVAYLIWKEPYMTVGGDTFISDMLDRCGFKNVFAEAKRYPVISIAELGDMHCEHILLSSEPYPFRQKHVQALKELLSAQNNNNSKPLLVDGEMFSWYGSHLLHAPEYFKTLINHIRQSN